MSLSVEQLQNWMVDYLSKLLLVAPEEVDVSAPFERFGLDSVTVVGMTGDFSEHFGIEVDPTMAYDYPTIEKFTAETVRRLQSRSDATADAMA